MLILTLILLLFQSLTSSSSSSSSSSSISTSISSISSSSSSSSSITVSSSLLHPTPHPTSSPTPCSIPTPQYNALHALYTATNGTGWKKGCNKNWVFSSINPDYSAPCNGWHGIMCNQCQVTQLNLTSCELEGTIPSELGAMTAMEHLILLINSLSGTIPSELSFLTAMTYLDLGGNSLLGTIPSQLGYTNAMKYLYLYNNSLSGTIPSELGSMTVITQLFLNGNSLSGTIPSQLGSMTAMTHFWLYNNRLSGTIPSELGSMTATRHFDLFNNSLSGTIPSHLGSMTAMKHLYLYSNCLSGTIPSELGSMTNMTQLLLNNNSLSGTIPSELGSIIAVKQLILSSNSLSGTIPSELGSMTRMEHFWLYSNRISGTIPSQLMRLTMLRYFYLDDNNLSGTVPSYLMTFKILNTISLANNRRLGGSIGDLFNANTSKSLEYIILAGMRLTGTLPDALFNLPKLYTSVLSSNCITGTLPTSICSSNISSLILDGVGVGSSCSNNRQSFHGSIPPCLFAMSTLSTLHLAGNGLTGTLPDIPTNSNLSTLSLASNRLTGDIPLSIQMHHFASIDLSSNKLTGTLVDSYQPPSSSVNMAVNRLSGNIPSSLRNVNATTSVNIIQGNLFGCPLLRNDVNSKETACGSSNLKYPFIAWLALVAVTLVVMIVIRYSRAAIIIQIRLYMLEWWETSCRCLSPVAGISVADAAIDGLYHTNTVMKYLACACSMSIILSSFFVLVVMMSFIAMKLHDTSHVNSFYQIQYLYSTTAAYFVGASPTVLLSLYITVSGIIVVILCTITRPKVNIARASSSESARRIVLDDDDAKEILDYRDAMSALTIRLAAGIVVTVAALAINYGFVSIVYFSHTPNLTAVNLAFAVIKSLYSSTIVPYSSRLVPKSSRQVYIVMIVIVVNVICPGLAVLLSSPLCLFYKLRPTSISASYDYKSFSCEVFCWPSTVDSFITITPQWFYSYQCSSSFLTSYLPNFVYLYIINGIISPSFDILAMILSSTGLAARCKAYMQSMFKSSDVFFGMYNKVAVGRVFLIAANSSSVSKPSDDVEMYALDHRDDKKDANRITTVTNATDNHDHYDINVTRLVPSLCVDITLLLTFGLASPLLAVVISYSIIINTLLWYVALGRYITIVNKVRSSSACYDHLERAFIDTWRCLPEAWWIMSIFIGLFWSLFVNDMVGDKNPTTGIVLAVMMMVWCPLVFISAHRMLAVNTDVNTTTNSNSYSSIGDYVHSISSSIHTIMWRHVIHFSSTTQTTSTSDNNSFRSNRVSTISETVSPLGSLNNANNK